MSSPSKRRVQCNRNTIETLVTSKATEINEWVREVYTRLDGNGTIVGLCIQCKPHPYNKTSNEIATLQLCIVDMCLFIQLMHLDNIPKSLKSFMLDPCFTFVGLGINCLDIVIMLYSEYDLACSRYEYLHDLCREACPSMYEKDGKKPSLSDLARQVGWDSMDVIPIETYLSNWEAPDLNRNQITYGCIYAYACFEIGLHMFRMSSKYSA